MIRVVLPPHLQVLAHVEGEVQVEIKGQATQRTVLDAIERRYPMLCGTTATIRPSDADRLCGFSPASRTCRTNCRMLRCQTRSRRGQSLF